MKGNKIGKVLLEAFILVIRNISKLLTIRMRQKIGAALGNFARVIMARRYQITLDNLRNSFPEKSDIWLESKAKASFENIGITFFETLTIDSYNKKNIHRIIEYKNIGLLNEVFSRGKGALFMSAHYSNWEILAYSAAIISDINMLIVVKHQKYADEIINKIRTSCGNQVIEMGRAARTMVQWLQDGKPAAMLADQSATADRDIFVDFFGRPAATYKAPAELALRFSIPVILGLAVRQNDGRYLVELQEINTADLKYDNDGVKELMNRYNKLLEAQIRACPEQWAWQHKRWKHQPKTSV